MEGFMLVLHPLNERNLFVRYENNPILTASHWPYDVNTVFNPGATLLKDGTTILLCRVEDRSGRSHLSIARSANGVNGWQVDLTPALQPDLPAHPEEIWGLEDPRITYLSDLEKYAITYTAYSQNGPGVAIALTKDFQIFERLGMVLPPEDKDAALFPTKFNNRWTILHRPLQQASIRYPWWQKHLDPSGAHIWISYSTDLRQWEDHAVALQARHGAWWDANKIGLSPPPLRTNEGWLFIYHGVRQAASGPIYRLGLALFDINNPERCILRGDSWVFGPEAPYERSGEIDNVVFPCGYTIRPDNDTLFIYYGAADTCICLATSKISDLLIWLKTYGKPSVPGEDE
jgi:predicted GH43/DUF377 family glycosyl hydrolase